MAPAAALGHLRPELTLGLPPGLTAATGMDAIAHRMETFMAAPFNPPADGIALDGLERGWAHIERATCNGQDRDARLNMMSTLVQGAMAFQKGLGAVHSLSHSLGGANPRLSLPTGLAAMGVEHALFERIVSGALADHCHKTNPRIASADDYHEPLEASL